MAICTCGRIWQSVAPAPPCPVHGRWWAHTVVGTATVQIVPRSSTEVLEEIWTAPFRYQPSRRSRFLGWADDLLHRSPLPYWSYRWLCDRHDALVIAEAEAAQP